MWKSSYSWKMKHEVELSIHCGMTVTKTGWRFFLLEIWFVWGALDLLVWRNTRGSFLKPGSWWHRILVSPAFPFCLSAIATTCNRGTTWQTSDNLLISTNHEILPKLCDSDRFDKLHSGQLGSSAIQQNTGIIDQLEFCTRTCLNKMLWLTIQRWWVVRWSTTELRICSEQQAAAVTGTRAAQPGFPSSSHCSPSSPPLGSPSGCSTLLSHRSPAGEGRGVSRKGRLDQSLLLKWTLFSNSQIFFFSVSCWFWGHSSSVHCPYLGDCKWM